MEKRQQESEQQVQSLLYETRKLREENDVLRAQVSSSGPSHDRKPKSQRTNSKLNKEVSFPRNMKLPYGSQEIRPNEKLSPAYQMLLNKSFDSTRVSTKRRHDKRSQLFDVMQAWLRPQTPGMEGRPRVAMA